MSKANVPNDGRRFLLATPDFYALLLQDKDHFVGASAVTCRMESAHRVLRADSICACYAPTSLSMSDAEGSSTGGNYITLTAGMIKA